MRQIYLNSVYRCCFIFRYYKWILEKLPLTGFTTHHRNKFKGRLHRIIRDQHNVKFYANDLHYAKHTRYLLLFIWIQSIRYEFMTITTDFRIFDDCVFLFYRLTLKNRRWHFWLEGINVLTNFFWIYFRKFNIFALFLYVLLQNFLLKDLLFRFCWLIIFKCLFLSRIDSCIDFCFFFLFCWFLKRFQFT